MCQNVRQKCLVVVHNHVCGVVFVEHKRLACLRASRAVAAKVKRLGIHDRLRRGIIRAQRDMPEAFFAIGFAHEELLL